MITNRLKTNQRSWGGLKQWLFLLIAVSHFLFFASSAFAAKDFIIAARDDSVIYMAESNGDGTWEIPAYIAYLGGGYTRGVIMGDFNNDTHVDFIVGRGISNSGYYYLYLNDGTNTFSQTAMIGTQGSMGSYTEDMAAGDFNNDGNLDFAASSNSSTVGIWLGDGNGGFTKTETTAWGSTSRGLDSADFNHDGNIDLVRGRYSSGYIDVYWGDGTGAFPTSTYLGDVGTDPYGVVAGDFDNDGHPDVFANYGSNGDTYFIKGNGDGTFAAPVYEPSLDLNTHGGFDAYDYDGDGNLDVVIANYTGRTLYYYPGNGDATFGAAVTIGNIGSTVFGISAMPLPAPAGRPAADIVPAAPAPIAEGGSIDFDGSGSTDSDGTVSGWAWTFGDTGTDTVENPAAHTYTDEGSYTVNLTVTDNDGKKDTASANVIVQGDLPVVDPTPVNFGEIFADYGLWQIDLDGADYASDTEGIASYAWKFGPTFTEDFEDGNADGWSPDAGTWEIEDASPITGTYSYRQTNTSTSRTWNLFDQVFYNDVTIEADVSLVAGSGEEAHILFRARDMNNNYEFILRGRGNNDVLLYRRVGGSATNVYEYNLPSTPTFSGAQFPIDVGNTYSIKIVLTGSQINFYLDDIFLFAYHDSTFMSGKVGFSTYNTHAVFDNLVVTSTGTGQNITHQFDNSQNVELTVTDAAGQATTGAIPMNIVPGAVPVADAGGPYAVDENAASEGGWTVTLDGSASSDDVEVQQYVWDLGTDTFDGTQINEGKWVTKGNVSQNGEIIVAHTDSGWNEHYVFSKDTYTRAPGMAFEASVNQASQNAMIGFKDTGTSGYYGNYPYAIYFRDGTISIYESGSDRGSTGYTYSYNTWYDIRIELKPVQGARYYYRLTGDTDWILLYDSDYSSATEFKRGWDVYQSTFTVDNIKEIAAGPTPTYRVYGAGVHTADLTVYDRAGQANTNTAQATITATGNGVPTALGGPDITAGESYAGDGIWTVNFDATTSSDDISIYKYEWDWNYDSSAGFNPSGDTSATPSHTWDAVGTYTVAVRVTDHALQTSIDVIQVTIEMGDPPVADAGPPISVNETTGNAYQGAWTVTLDGSGSTDDTPPIDRYFWTLGTETFDGTRFNGGKWYHSGTGITQDDAVRLTSSAEVWASAYMVTKGTVARHPDHVFQVRFKAEAFGDIMFGFKNSNTTNFSYNQFPHQFYIYDQNIRIHEYSTYRLDTGYDILLDTWYDFRIELTDTGAVYSYKLATDTDWTVLYTGTYVSGDTVLRKGATLHSGTFWFDDIVETAEGETPTVYLSGLGSHTIALTTYDNVAQSDTDTSSVTLLANDPPTGDAGADQSFGETDAVQGTWAASFSGTASDDGPNGVNVVEWDFDYDGSTFVPSGQTGLTPSHTFTSVGVYTVAMRVVDHANQSTLDTLTVTITGGAVPTANAGADITTEGERVVRFDGTGSTDDLRIYKYEWAFGDGIMGTGQTPAHVYHTPGAYTATLTVWDEAGQSNSDTVTVTVLAAGQALPPVASAGGPYTAAAGGPPAYFNASASTDDYGIVKYFWDVDAAVDSDSDGNFTNDVDVVGRKPFYTYAATGQYTATLTVEDGAGQQATASALVNVADNLPPDVICVPWRGSDPTVPHDAISGENTRLKAIVRDAGTLEYRWNFGDGSGWGAWTAVSNNYAIEADHAYTGAVGTPYTATLEVKDSLGLVGQDLYYLTIGPNNYDTRTNIAIDNGLWYIHKQQIRPSGYWQYGSYELASTASSLQSFVINTHVQGGDHQEDPYVETVTKGYTYMFQRLQTRTTSVQTAGNPDTNGNGFGVEIDESDPIYQGGPVMDAIASTNTPGAFVYSGRSGVAGRYYVDVLRDMTDAFAWGQGDSSSYRGGWRYNWNSSADNSACQWAAIGMIAAEDNFGIWVPSFVKPENNNYWLQHSYNGTGFGYTDGNTSYTTAGTPSGMVQLAFDEVYTSDPRWQTAEAYLASNWIYASNYYYAIYAMTKALRLAQPNPVVTFSSTGLDWYNDPTNGLRKYLVDVQEASGSWYYNTGWAGGSDRDLSTPWVVIMLTPALFTQPPEADAGDDIIWAYDLQLSFSAAGSRHLDPLRNIVLYEWDFDGDGTYDYTTTDPSDPAAVWTYPDPNPGVAGDVPQVFTVKLRVTDDNDPVQTDIDTREVTVAEPPHAPFAVTGGPYRATAGIPFTLDGGQSFDVDLGDSVVLYQWDLDNDGVFFDDIDLETPNATASFTYAVSGVYNIGLKVQDLGVFNPLGCVPGDPTNPCTPMDSLPKFTTVTVEDNIAPVADAGGPYTVEEGTALMLDGTASSDPNGDTLTYAWDLDDDGSTDDSTDPQPSWTFMDDGSYTVTLTVSDSLLTDTTTATVEVTDKAPTADFTWLPEPGAEGSPVNFTDASGSSPDTIVSWNWDFGDGQTDTVQNPNHTYTDDGTYDVTLTVTDDDGSVDSITKTITITDQSPTAVLAGDTVLDEGQTGSYDASGSTSPADAIVQYEWDWNYDGTTFFPSVDTGATQTHSWGDNGTYVVAVRVTDDDGSTDMTTLTVTVNNTDPVADAGDDQTVDEGDTVAFNGAFTDPGAADTHTISWDFGDGTPAVSGTLTPTHVYADNGIYTVTLTVTDDDGGVGIDTLIVTVNNVAPAVNAGPDQTVDEGDIVIFTGAFTDPGSADTYTVSLDFGDGSPAVSLPLATHVYADNGVYTVTLTVTDDDGGVGTDTLIVTVNNVAPDVDAGAALKTKEGDTVAFTGSFSDPGSADTHTISWDFGDGSPVVTGTLTPTHVYADNGSYTVTLTVTDDDGGVGTGMLTVDAVNVAPSVDAGADQTVDEGDTVTFGGAFTDPGSADTHTISWDFGDGTPAVTGTLTPTHVFAGNGDYMVTLTVTDDDGGVGTDTLTVTVTQLQSGTIIVEKQTEPDGETISFYFTTSYGPNFALSDGQTNNSGPLAPGTYSVSEINIPADWTQSSVVVSDGSDPSAISLQPGETVTVTFTNTKEIPPQSVCGDLDGDGDVDFNDRGIFLSAYGSCDGDANFNAAADYDHDGCITRLDYRAWYLCYRDYLLNK